MTIKGFLCCGVAAASLVAGNASAATINLIGIDSITNAGAKQGFIVAANYWATMFTNDVVINLGVKFAPLAPNIIGSTGSSRNDVSVADWQAGINATKSNSTLDQSIVLPALNADGGVGYIANGVNADSDQTAFTANKYYVDGDQTAAQTLYLNTSVTKAVGGIAAYDPVRNPGQLDGSVTFSSTFGFDFDPSNDVKPKTFDFIGVAIHEIGHALGFVSGIDLVDYYSFPNGPGRGALGYNFNDTSLFSSLDMFRYSSDPSNIAPGTGPSLDLTIGGTKYFSIDGGATALFGNTFSTGSYNGDGNQASHWKDASGANRCGPQLGIMDPTFCYGQTGYVTALDLAAFDAMGWNLSVDALANGGSYNVSTSTILRNYLGIVPEPGTWVMMIAGFGLVGSAMRRRVTKVTFTTA